MPRFTPEERDWLRARLQQPDTQSILKKGPYGPDGTHVPYLRQAADLLQREFQQHFTAVSRRMERNGLRERHFPRELQQAPKEFDTHIMADVPPAVDEVEGVETEGGSGPVSACVSDEDVDMDKQGIEEPMDLMEDVLNHMDELLQTWDIDVELEAAKRTPAAT